MTEKVSRRAASEAVQDLGWRYILGTLRSFVTTDSTAEAAGVVSAAAEACGADADEQLGVDVRAGRVDLVLVPQTSGHVDMRSLELASAITLALRERGWQPQALPESGRRGVQGLEIAIDTMDRDKIYPFWKAVLGYVEDPLYPKQHQLIDPLRQGPALWFQQMDEPREQRNRIHFDITVPQDEADARIAAALEAGGTLVSDAEARAFWILADADGNEICVCTWEDRD